MGGRECKNWIVTQRINARLPFLRDCGSKRFLASYSGGQHAPVPFGQFGDQVKDIVNQLLAMLTRKQKRAFRILQLLFCVTALLQVSGAAAIGPFVALLSNPALIHKNPIFSYLFQMGGFRSDISYMLACALLVMATIAVSNAA